MFKNASIFKVDVAPGVAISESLQRLPFVPTGPTQVASIGFVPPRDLAAAPLVEHIAGHLLMRVMTETRSVPAATLKKAVDEMAASVERETGRKPGKKMRLELKEAALLELLPKAFPKQAATWVWMDTDAGRLVIDSASASRCEDIVTTLVRAIDGVKAGYVQTDMSPVSIMTGWVHDQQPDFAEFSIGRQALLEAPDESRAKVAYTNHALDSDEVRNHVTSGKSVTKLGLSWKNRVGFVLDKHMVLARIEFDDVVLGDGATPDEAERLDADFAIATGELKPLIDDLIAALGGEREGQEQ